MVLDVAGPAENRLAVTNLRCTAPIAALSLIDPQGVQRWRSSELNRVPAAQTPRPELGDVITTLPELRDAASGAWRLLIERAPPLAKPARCSLIWQVWDRYLLHAHLTTTALLRGETVLVNVSASDYGLPASGAGEVSVRVLDAQGAELARVKAVEYLAGPLGGPISRQPGDYLARLKLASPGAQRLLAEWRPAGRREPVLAAPVSLTVAPQAGAELRSLAAEPDGPAAPGACPRGLRLNFEARAAQPGTFILGATVRGPQGQLQRASAGVALTPQTQPVSLTVPLAKLGWRPQRLEWINLVGLSVPGTRVLAELDGVALDAAAWPQGCAP